jgi:hypothetical protein
MSQVIGYPATASGPSSPTLTITSPNTVDRYSSPATDAAGNIYLHSAEFTQECSEVAGSEKILVFAPAAGGTLTANPIRTISGPSANLYGAGLMAVDGPGNIYLWQSDYTRTKPATIVEFAAGADGNVAPIRTIEVAQYPSGNGAGFPAGLGVDGEGNIIFAVANLPTTSGGISTESDTIAVFTPGQTSNATPARTISGPASQLTQIAGLGSRCRQYLCGDVDIRNRSRPDDSRIRGRGGQHGIRGPDQPYQRLADYALQVRPE